MCSAGGSSFRDTPQQAHSADAGGELSGGSGLGPGGSRTLSVGSLHLPGAAASRAQASLNAEVLAVGIDFFSRLKRAVHEGLPA